MAICTFFGHRECPSEIQPILLAVLEEIVETQQADTFYVGNQGQFDAYVRKTLRQLQTKYPHIRYSVVLPYLPGKKREGEDFSDTILPEGIETVPPRFAISWRNRWMLANADIVVTYITHNWGGAAQFAEDAQKQKKTVIKLDGRYDTLPNPVVDRLLENDLSEIAPLSVDALLAIGKFLASQSPISKEEVLAAWERFQLYYMDS